MHRHGTHLDRGDAASGAVRSRGNARSRRPAPDDQYHYRIGANESGRQTEANDAQQRQILSAEGEQCGRCSHHPRSVSAP